MRKIIYYQKENGKIPVRDFLWDLAKSDKSLAAKIRSKLKFLSFDLLGERDVKFIGDKIYELRIKDTRNIARVFYFSYEYNDIILLDAIIKKDQKLKNTDIERCKAYKNDYIKRFGNI